MSASSPLKVGDLVRFPGFPDLLRIDAVTGVKAEVSWGSGRGPRSKITVPLAGLLPQARGQLVNLFVDRLELLEGSLPRPQQEPA